MSYRVIVLVFCLAIAVSSEILTRKIGKKIIGGRTTDISVVPYQVSLMYYTRHYCGGAIIDLSWILTAAHCAGRGTPDKYSVRVGSSIHHSGGVVVNVSKIIVHPDYNVNVTHNYDVALLKLEHPLKTSRKIKVIPLTDFEPKRGDQILISGWGHYEEKSSFSEKLQSAVIPIVSRNKCYNYGFYHAVSKTMICAGFSKGGKDSCKGDSGGPAVFNNKLVGVVSWGSGCARRNAPGVYANVAFIRSWIKSAMS